MAAKTIACPECRGSGIDPATLGPKHEHPEPCLACVGTGEQPKRSTAASSRRKGVKGEREVARMWERGAFVVRGLEGQGDHLAIRADGLTIHVEVKRQERLKLPEWLRQAQAEAPGGTVPVVAFRQNRGEWFAALPLAALVELAR